MSNNGVTEFIFWENGKSLVLVRLLNYILIERYGMNSKFPQLLPYYQIF